MPAPNRLRGRGSFWSDLPPTDGEPDDRPGGSSPGRRGPSAADRRANRARRQDQARRLRLLRWSVGSAATFAIVILVSLAFSDPTPQGESPSSSPTGVGSRPSGIVSRLVTPAEIGTGFVEVNAERQTITDLAVGVANPPQERERLAALGMREAAIAVDVKPPEAGGALAGGSITVQIVRFGSPAAVMVQLEHDRAGALAADFGIRSVDSTSDASVADGAFVLRGRGAPGSAGRPATVAAMDVAAGEWQVLVVSEAVPGSPAATDDELGAIAHAQIARLQ